MRGASLTALGLSSALVTVAGCSWTQDVAMPPIAVPASLTTPCIYESDPQTVGDLYESFAGSLLALAECNERMEAIRGLSPESEKPE